MPTLPVLDLSDLYWWDSFENMVFIPEKLRENFCKSWTSLLQLTELLRPHIEGQETVMRSPVKKAACTQFSQLQLCIFKWMDLSFFINSAMYV